MTFLAPPVDPTQSLLPQLTKLAEVSGESPTFGLTGAPLRPPPRRGAALLAPSGLPGPLVPNAPAAQLGAERQLERDLPFIRSNFSPGVANSYLKFIRERARRGITPLSPGDAKKALKAAETGKAQTEPPSRNPLDVLGNIAADIGDITGAIPQLLDPRTWAREFGAIPEELPKALASGDVGKILQAPGVRLIPGAYVGANLAEGDISEIVSHPVMSLLDVLPYGKKFKVGQKVGRIQLPGRDVTLADIGHRTTGALKRSPVGQFVQEAWAPQVRTAAEGAEMFARRGDLASNPALAGMYPGELEDLARATESAAARFNKAFPDKARAARVYDAVTTDTRLLGSQWDDLSDVERAAVNDVLDVSREYVRPQFSEGNLPTRVWRGQEEVFTATDARALDRVEGRVSRATALNTFHKAIATPGTTDLPTLQSTIRNGLDAPNLTAGERRNLARGYVHSLEANGFDMGDLYQRAGKLTAKAADDFLAETSTRLQGQQPTAAVITRDRLRDQWLNDNRGATDAMVARVDKAAEKVRGRTVPARWQPTVARAYESRVSQAVAERSGALAPTDPRLPQLTRAVQDRDYGRLMHDGIVDPAEIHTWQREALGAIDAARAQGVQPAFVKTVSTRTAEANLKAGVGKVTTLAPEPSQWRRRTDPWDWTPASRDLGVAVDAQRIELLRRQGSQGYVDWLESPEGLRGTGIRSRAEWETELRPVAQRMAARRGIGYGQAIENLMRRTAVPWTDTKTGFATGKWGEYRYTKYDKPDELFVAKPVADSMRRMVAPPSALESALRPSLQLFRTAILPFSIRWHTNNLLGNTFMTALEDPRALAQLGKGMEAARDIHGMNRAMAAGRDYTVKPTTEAILGSMPPRMRASLGSLSHAVDVDSLARFKGGQTAGKALAREWASKGFDTVDKIANKSYEFNQLADDAYRISSYLSGQKRGLARGLSAEDAAKQGEALVMKVAPRWNQMTPLERSVFRAVFPFYSFMSHVVRYAYRYPVDHPVRVAVGSSFLRAEMEDNATGLPGIFRSMIGLGATDEGMETFLNPGAANPFRDLGDIFTFGGLMSQTNPLFKVALGQLGYDEAAQGPDLYPTMEYDPKTGRFKPTPTTTPGLLGQVAEAIIPQTAVIGALLGASGEYKELARSNPEAARRMLLSSAGVPLLWRTENVHELQFKGELNRQQSQKEALGRALKSGDYSEASRYPTLAPYINQLRKLASSGQLEAFKPPPEEATVNPAATQPLTARQTAQQNTRL